MKQIKTPNLNIRDTRVGLWSLRLACACGAHGDEVRLAENCLHSGPGITIPPLWNDLLGVILSHITYIFLENLSYTEFYVHLTELYHLPSWCSSGPASTINVVSAC